MAFIESGKSHDKEAHYEKMKKVMENKDVNQYTLRIPADLHTKVKIKIAKENIKLRELLLGWLKTYVESP